MRTHAIRARTCARLLAAVGIVAGTCWWGPGSRASVSVGFQCVPGSQSPSPDPRPCTPTQNQAVDGTWTISIHAQASGAGNRLRVVQLFIKSEDSKTPPDPGTPVAAWGDGSNGGPDWGGCNGPVASDLAFGWNTATLTPYNGAYTIQAVVTSQNIVCNPDDQSSAQVQHVKVNNPPATPAKPAITFVGASVVTLQFQKAPEPDVLSYTLYRAHKSSRDVEPRSGDFTVRQTFNSFESPYDDRDVTGPAAYWYQLRVTRYSPVSSDGISAQSANSDAASVPGPTPSPTASRGGGGTSSSTPHPVLTPKPGAPRATAPPLPKVVAKPAPVPDAPFSAVLPYQGVPEPGGSNAQAAPSGTTKAASDGEEGPAHGAALPVAVGTFMVSAALALGRMTAAA